ncbi:DEAD/DEAH box helicase [Immundisolibacter cernigliae]|uniref:DEAD/DEAH box helicase n=1 Tax=Immundisolibacter cernigliae TaxID=1810504 RepID=UPI0009F25B51|nr:DEAD/DEAH box helicase [Immundisolibacter cernigliae]
MSTEPAAEPTFADLDLPPALLQAVTDLGYETPSPIQARIIPHLLAGRDVLGQAQTGTGKTAAFALPLLARIDPTKNTTQVLVLAPTRELALQVAEAFGRYGAHLPGIRVMAIYGGQGYREQLQGLRRGAHVVVGTPGRVMDHMTRGSLDLSGLSALVLDEADEMLRMGFIDDVEFVLSESPSTRQLALFSATLPAPIKRIAQKHLNDPQEVSIKVRTTTAETINQRYWSVGGGVPKREALTRILETTPHEGVLIFVRTKIETQELADYLNAQGFAAAPLSGDIVQSQREHTVNRLKSGQLDLVVATDVAARGLDVERISHVINYDIPYDTEAYVHRIGRTGRAGRSGEAILFVAPREARMLQAIERATRQRIEEMPLPGVEAVNQRRIGRFMGRIDEALANAENADTVALFKRLLGDYVQEKSVEPIDIAAALAAVVQGSEPLLLAPERPQPKAFKPRAEGPARERTRDSAPGERRPARGAPAPDEHLESYRVEVGSSHGVKPSNLVGAIANEIGLDSKFIGRIEIYDHHSTVDLPQGLPKDLMAILKRTRVAGQPLAISRVADGAPIANPYQRPRPFRGPAPEGAPRPFKPRPAGDKTFKPKAKTGYPKRKPGDGPAR